MRTVTVFGVLLILVMMAYWLVMTTWTHNLQAFLVQIETQTIERELPPVVMAEDIGEITISGNLIGGSGHPSLGVMDTYSEGTSITINGHVMRLVKR